jgi:hypothetical protein
MLRRGSKKEILVSTDPRLTGMTGFFQILIDLQGLLFESLDP